MCANTDGRPSFSGSRLNLTRLAKHQSQRTMYGHPRTPARSLYNMSSDKHVPGTTVPLIYEI